MDFATLAISALMLTVLIKLNNSTYIEATCVSVKAGVSTGSEV